MNPEPLYPDVAPPAFLQLAGHPLRWRLLRELGRSDRKVNELMDLVGEPQNLVSYHLGKLRIGRLVSARRSSADGRDTYYGLDLVRVGALLSATGGALHPGLRLTRALGGTPLTGPVRVLFLCTGNSARSQMAEALARARSGGAIDAMSAGSHPKPLHPNAVRVMREGYGLDLAGQTSKPLSLFTDEPFDWVISLCDRVREACPEFPGVEEGGRPQTVHWSLANPVTGESDEVTYPRFQETAAELSTRIDYLLALLTERASAAGSPGEAHDRPQ